MFAGVDSVQLTVKSPAHTLVAMATETNSVFCPEGGAGLGLRRELGAVAGRRPAAQRRNSTSGEGAGGVVRTKDVLTGESHHAVDLWNQEVWISCLVQALIQ